jgi:hypothetical protein
MNNSAYDPNRGHHDDAFLTARSIKESERFTWHTTSGRGIMCHSARTLAHVLTVSNFMARFTVAPYNMAGENRGNRNSEADPFAATGRSGALIAFRLSRPDRPA